MMWFALELGGGELGLAELCAAVAPALWLFPVVFMTRRVVAQSRSPLKPEDEPETPRAPNTWMPVLMKRSSRRSEAT
jgi:hypothetical protein